MAKDRKISIIEAAIKSVAEVGFKKTNARTVAARLGIQPSNVFYYFRREPDLTLAMVERIVEANVTVVAALFGEKNPQSNLEKIMCYLDGNIQWAFAFPEQVTVLVYGISEGQSDENLLALVSRALGTGESKVYNFLAAGLAENEFKLPEGFKPQQVAKLLHQSLTGQIVRSITEPEQQQAAYRQRLKALVSLLT